MKLKITFWLIVAVCCAALGIGQKQHVSTVLREYKTLWRDYEYKDSYRVLYKPHIPKRIAQSDPEAAAIADVILRLTEDYEERLFLPAEYLLKFPLNEFLLCELMERLSYDNGLDPDIRAVAAQRLISINPQKLFYRYLFADALLSGSNTDNIYLVLDEIERGNRCFDYNRPYDQFKQRVIDLADKAKLSQFKLRELDQERFILSPDDLDRKLINIAATAFAEGDNLLGTRICDAVYEMQRNYLLAGDPRAICLNNLRMISSIVNFGNWLCPEALELQRVDLSKERAKENRIRLCSRIPEIFLADREKPPSMEQPEIKDKLKAESALIALTLAPHFGKMFVALVLTVIVLLLLGLLCGSSQNKTTGIVKILMFAFACLIFLLVTTGILLRWVGQRPCCPIAYSEILRPIQIGLNLLTDKLILVLIFIVAPLAGLFLLQIAKKKWLCRWKIVWLLAAAVLLGFIAFIFRGYFYIELMVMLVFILFSAITITGPSPKDRSPIASLFRLTDTDPQATAIRADSLKLVSPFIVLYWLIFMGLMPASAYRINYEIDQYMPPVKKDYALPEPNEAAYQKMLDYVKNQSISQYKALNLIGLVMPEDLPGVLEKIKAIPLNSPEYWMPPMVMPGPRRGFRGVSGEPNMIDIFLTRAITSSGRDATNVITAAITEPNHPRTLLARAKLGDLAAKQPLENLLTARITQGNNFPRAEVNTHWRDSPLTSAEIIPALACVSEPNEAAQRYLDYIRRSSVLEWLEETDFCRSINLLPTQQARLVIKAYITQAQQFRHANLPSDIEPYHIPGTQDILNRLRIMLISYSDREIAEEVFRLMLLTDEEGQEVPLIDIPLPFTSESADLLKKGINARDDNFRSWSVWQLRKVGYKFTQEEIDNLMHDKSWMVRANAIVAEPKKTKNLTATDKNSFVRFVVSLFSYSI